MSRCRKILIVIGVVFAVTILIPFIRHYQLRFAVEAYIAQLKAKGEPIELAQVIPPPVPPEQNSADTFRNAAALIDADKSLLETNYPYGMKMVALGKAMIRWQQPDIRDSNATNSWQEATTAVAQNAQAIALLQQIIEKPSFDFKIEYEPRVADMVFTNFYLAQSKRAAQRLEAAALCDLHQGDTASAVKNLRAMLALVSAMRNERLVISELVRIAIAQITLTANWEFLQSTNLTDEQLAKLQQDWTGLNFIRSFENAMALERVTRQTTAKKFRASSSELENYLNVSPESDDSSRAATTFDILKTKAKVFLWRYWWSYPDELRMLEGYEALLESTRLAETNHSLRTAINGQKQKLEVLGIYKIDNKWDALLDHDMQMHRLLSASVASLNAVSDHVMRLETAKIVLTTAIALKRYQLKHGNYPSDLNSLVPEFVPAVPLDPVDGQPLRYRRNADGTFLLYSVGENGVDDGGDPSLEKGVTSSNLNWLNPHALDWVWPQPATAAEIQKYYEELAKKAAN
jgi:hypothetical protein